MVLRHQKDNIGGHLIHSGYKDNLKQAGLSYLGLTQAETVSLELDHLRVGLENIS